MVERNLPALNGNIFHLLFVFNIINIDWPSCASIYKIIMGSPMGLGTFREIELSRGCAKLALHQIIKQQHDAAAR